MNSNLIGTLSMYIYITIGYVLITLNTAVIIVGGNVYFDDNDINLKSNYDEK